MKHLNENINKKHHFSQVGKMVGDSAVFADSARNLDNDDVNALFDVNGLPAQFRIMKYGAGSFTKEGVKFDYIFTREMADEIVAEVKRRGVLLPIDCEHAAFLIAEKLGIEENEIPALYLEKTAAGYFSLFAMEDGLYAKIEKWVPRAEFLLTEKLYRYFSPVIRGLKSGKLRITSLALTNKPAIDNVDTLAASAEVQEILISINKQQNSKKEVDSMDPKLMAALEKHFGKDVLALTADGKIEDVDKLIQKMDEIVGTAKESENKVVEFVKNVKAPLCLTGEDIDLTKIEGQVLAFASKVSADQIAMTTMKNELDGFKSQFEKRSKEELIAKGKAEGKLVGQGLLNWATKQDSVELTEFLAAAPVIVAPGKTDKQSLPGNTADSAVLTAEDRKVIDALGITEEAYLKSKKQLALQA